MVDTVMAQIRTEAKRSSGNKPFRLPCKIVVPFSACPSHTEHVVVLKSSSPDAFGHVWPTEYSAKADQPYPFIIFGDEVKLWLISVNQTP